MTFPSFQQFFAEINDGHDPFPWQTDLAEHAVEGTWPSFIAVPTGCGKTACLEVAVYTMAAQAYRPSWERTAPRRIFFIVNRRVIVDEAFRRAGEMAKALAEPGIQRPACGAVAAALRSLNPVDPLFPKRKASRPLECVQLRGAIYRDQRWARSLLQPMIVASTLDQVGSRLLFRGYGVSPQQAPIHAALVATDALWLLDEAHISRPFAETVAAIQRYRQTHSNRHPAAFVPPELRFVQLTATPPKEAADRLELTPADRAHPILAQRLSAAKPAWLCVSDKGKLVENLCEKVHAIDPAQTRSVAIMVNRVATARAVYDRLANPAKKKDALPFEANVRLLIGRMRPLDRDRETEAIQLALKRSAKRDPDAERVEIVVATQCLEVGADLDFDALVTECASLDALRQRFGRLNRQGRAITASAAIVVPTEKVLAPDAIAKLPDDAKSLDPLYGKALPSTWNWLQSVATEGVVDFGLDALRSHVDALPKAQLAELQAPTSSAPVLFPGYLDAWAQTDPIPWPDPDLGLFLHGKQEPQLDVLVCWRADLDESNRAHWDHLVSLCPPSQIEALPVPLPVFKRWFFSEKPNPSDDTGDLLAVMPAEETRSRETLRPRCDALLWKGLAKSGLLDRADDLYPGATLVLPATAGGWSALGHIPDAPPDPATARLDKPVSPESLRPIDVAEEGFLRTRDRAILRLHPALLDNSSESETWSELWERTRDFEANLTKLELATLLDAAHQAEAPGSSLAQKLAPFTSHPKHATANVHFVHYPNAQGLILTTQHRLGRYSVIPQGEDEADSLSRAGDQPVTLATHTRHVLDLVRVSLDQLGLHALGESLEAAARLHDWGKLDSRFQALLLGGNPHASYALPRPLAKSGQHPTSFAAYEAARQRANLPKGFRHEFASLLLAEQPAAATALPTAAPQRALALHLIASHHGYGRPFAPVIDDEAPPPVSTRRLGEPVVEVSPDVRREHPAHRLDSGIAERFWQLLRQHGWWGLAYLETLLRLADQQASEAEAEGWYDDREPSIN